MKYIYLTVILIVAFTACNPVATPTLTAPQTAASTETPSPSPTALPLTPTASPSITQEIPTIPPGPTSTALPTLEPGHSLTLTSIYMMDEKNGWGIDVAGHIVRTADGGNTWKDITPYRRAYQDRGFFALDVNTAWATSDQQACYVESCAPLPNKVSVWHTSDGGDTWQEGQVCLQGQDCNFDFDIISPDYYRPSAIHFVDAQTGWLLVTVAHLMFQDRYRLYQTVDGGAHWSPILDSFKGPMTMNVTGLVFQNKQTGWMSTSEIDGATDPIAAWSIYQSADGGLTWNELQLPVPNLLPKAFTNNTIWCGAMGVVAIPPNALGVTIECNVYTNPLSSYDFYFYSTDDGKHWISWLKTGDVEFINQNVGWQSTLDNGIYYLEQTRDGGQTWARIKAVQWSGALDFVDEQTGWAIAVNVDVTALVHTKDGGQTWKEIKPVVEP